MADEVLGVGTSFSGSALGEILTCRDIEGPNAEADDIDVSSNVDAVADAGINFHRRFRPGLVDGGEIKITAVFTAAGYASVLDNLRVQQAFTITSEDGSTLVTGLESYIKSVSAAFPYEEEATFEFTVKVSGESTFTPA